MEALFQRESDLEAIFKHAAVGLSELSLDGGFLQANEALHRFLGRPSKELLGADVREVTHPDDLPATLEGFRRLIETGEPVSFDKRYVRPDGEVVWANSSLTRLDDEEGRPVRVLVVTVDLTERRRAVEALRESEARYRLIVEGAREYAMFMMDAERRITTWSSGAERILGYTEEEAVGQLGDIIFTAEDRAAGAPEREQAKAARDGQAEDERPHVRKDGSPFWASGVMMALYAEDGRPRGFVKILRDNTARKRAEEALEESEARFRAAAETVPDILFTASPDGLVDYVNPRFEEITGAPAEAALGTQIWPEFMHPDDRGKALAAWAQGLRSEERYEDRHRLLTADGSYCWHLSRARPVYDAEGRVVKWFGTCTDINRIVKAEEEVNALNATLEERVAERTEQVRMLAQALTLAEQEERKRIADVLHDDLQQMLVGAKMRLAMIQKEPTMVEELQALLGNSISLARSLSTELAPPILRGEDLEEALLWLASRSRELHGMEVEVDVEPGCSVPHPSIRVLLYQILRELLFNVVKHAGTERASVRAWREGGQVHLTVADQGAGFDLKAPGAGGGTGLYNVRERLALFGGGVHIESAPGRGTRTTISIPVRGHERDAQ